jgi:hypothetical protein
MKNLAPYLSTTMQIKANNDITGSTMKEDTLFKKQRTVSKKLTF